MTEYADRVEQELESYADFEAAMELPRSHDVWAERYVLPLLHDLGFGGLLEFWDDTVAAACGARAPESARLVSVGAGDGSTELELAARLARRGHSNLDVVLLEINPGLLADAKAHAERLGLGERVTALETDLNDWHAGDVPVDIYFANHSLHHIVELERVFDEIRRTLRPDGAFLVNDMIGRNGHVRWPEAMRLLEPIWARTPDKYRVNRFTGEPDAVYPDADCSGEGFEGVRAQDILPLLLERFYPDVFVTFASVIDPFVDRTYGFNFDVDDPADRAFLEAVGQFDDAAIDLGLVTPTHLIGSFRIASQPARYPRDRSPARMVRDPDAVTAAPGVEPVVADPELSARIAKLETQANDGWRRYEQLRNRRIVRLALWVAALRNRLRRRS